MKKTPAEEASADARRTAARRDQDELRHPRARGNLHECRGDQDDEEGRRDGDQPAQFRGIGDHGDLPDRPVDLRARRRAVSTAMAIRAGSRTWIRPSCRCQSTYHALFGKDPEVKAIHAGLECGIIGERYPGMDMLSFGPTLEGVHSPDEKIHIDTVEKYWNFLLGILSGMTRSRRVRSGKNLRLYTQRPGRRPRALPFHRITFRRLQPWTRSSGWLASRCW